MLYALQTLHNKGLFDALIFEAALLFVIVEISLNSPYSSVNLQPCYS